MLVTASSPSGPTEQEIFEAGIVCFVSMGKALLISALITEIRRFNNHEHAFAEVHPLSPQEMIEVARRNLVEATAAA